MSAASPPLHTAAIVLIGNEILSGKTRDENAAYLLRELRSLGVDTRRVEVIPDEEETIIDSVNRCRAYGAHLFTSGGIGTTHDDITIPAVAKALNRPVVRHPDLVAMLRAHFGARLDEIRLRMAEIPEGSELLWGAGNGLRYPVVLAENILILPGVPSLLVEKFDAVRERYRAPAIALVNLFVSSDESDIAAIMTEATERFAGIAIGSYPRFDRTDHRVKVTVESRDAALVAACAEFLRERLGTAILRESTG